MRRSICFTDPAYVLAGEVGHWKFAYTTAVSLPKGAKLRFDPASKGRDIDWEIPDLASKSANTIYMTMENGKALQAKEVYVGDALTPQFEFTLPTQVKSGETVTIHLGPPKGKKQGNGAQTTSQRRRPFYLYVDPKGKGHYDEPEVFTVDVKGGPLHTIKVLTPSLVVKNRRFDVVVRFEDQFGNLTNNTDEETLIELTYENIRENLSWKLFLPETGFLTLPNLYFNELGVFTIKLTNTLTGETFTSCPMISVAESTTQLLWGQVHGESERYDSTESIENCLRHFRDELAYNFFITSPFENAEETPNDVWKLIAQNVGDFDEEDRFNTLLGFQWEGAPKEEGIRQIVYSKDNRPILRQKDTKYNTLKKIYKAFTPKDLLSIPTFTTGTGFGFDFEGFNPEFERVVEIYNAWGSAECSEKEGNLFPVKPNGKKGVKEWPQGTVQNALNKNCRFGFVSGGLDDRGIYYDFFDDDQVQYTPGSTAVLAKSNSRSAVYEALYNRSCYATTGPRIIIHFTLSGFTMGQQTSTEEKPGLMVNRHFRGTVAGTSDLKSVEIVRNGEVIATFNSKTYWLDFEYDDLTQLSKIALDGGKGKPPFVYYYLRVLQKDGNMAWSSPIWIDDLGMKSKKAKKVKTKE